MTAIERMATASMLAVAPNTPEISPTRDYVQIIMQESPQHPGQRATTEPPLDAQSVGSRKAGNRFA